MIEQAQSDRQGDDRLVPIIVEKCITAVEFKGTFSVPSKVRLPTLYLSTGMDYEGIYRKTGGSSQSKMITHLFERGQYESFDLLDNDAFNDISSITSVLKSYLRSLPNPLFTFELHDAFIQVTSACN